MGRPTFASAWALVGVTVPPAIRTSMTTASSAGLLAAVEAEAKSSARGAVGSSEPQAVSAAAVSATSAA
ncbi:Uncharacterised protein [Mycobacteroides abscessus subsp. abscessus]|nr:Uncharacterised protein [Mycobacteroides abscessus subsp. abscessus]